MRKNGVPGRRRISALRLGAVQARGEHGHRVGFGALHARGFARARVNGGWTRRAPLALHHAKLRRTVLRRSLDHAAHGWESRQSAYPRAACPARKLALTHRGPHPAAAPSPPRCAAPTGVSASCPRTCLPFCQLPRFPRMHKAGRSAYAASPGSFHYPAARRPAQDMWQAQKWPPPRSRIAGRSWEQMSLA